MNKKNSIISIKNITKKFGEFIAVDNVSLEVKKGEVFAFLGPNGAGKSTTIKMLTTLSKQNKGKITINGFDTLNEQNNARRSFGIVFQDPSLDLELTAYENMEFHAVLYGLSKGKRETQITKLLDSVGLLDRKDSLVKTFSGGMKRRLEIARGLIHHPKILFLDEPTLGLDTQTRHFLWKHLKDLNQKENMTIFLTTHYLDEAEQIADKIAVIDKGKIVAFGTTSEIKKQTQTKSLEEAFLKLTGKEIRKEKGSSKDMMRSINKLR